MASLINLLNALGAVDPSRAVELEVLAKYMGIEVSKLKELVESLVREGFVLGSDGKYYLSKAGQRAAMGLIS